MAVVSSPCGLPVFAPFNMLQGMVGLTEVGQIEVVNYSA